MLLCTAYRPPSSSVSSWTHDFGEMLEVTFLKNNQLVIMGDFNIDLLDEDSTDRAGWLQLLSITFNLSQVVSSPTRRSQTLVESFVCFRS